MKIQLYCEDTLETVFIPMQDVAAYVELIKQHGYMDDQGGVYVFQHAMMESGEVFCITLEPEGSEASES